MLVLICKVNESVHIGKDIRIKILDQKGNAVRIGIAAPKNIKVLREGMSEEPFYTTPKQTSEPEIIYRKKQ